VAAEDRRDGAACWTLHSGVPADATRLAALLAWTHPGAWTVEGLAGELARPDGLCVWLEAEGAAASVALGRVVLDRFDVLDVGTRPHRRRLGAARRVLGAVLGRGAGRGCAVADLELQVSNVAALFLYESLGFVVVGRRPRYYPDGEDAVLMSGPLAGPAPWRSRRSLPEARPPVREERARVPARAPGGGPGLIVRTGPVDANVARVVDVDAAVDLPGTLRERMLRDKVQGKQGKKKRKHGAGAKPSQPTPPARRLPPVDSRW